MKFEELGLCEPMLKSINDLGFTEPTEVQEESIPLILEGHDVIAGSATGSGKTLAFSSAIIEHVEQKGMVQAIVLTPTRELCEQVAEEIKKYSRYKDLRITKVYGGVSINPQIDKLRSTDIVVATPGRMLDHMERGTVDLTHVKIAVLDEADRMLDMGFIEDVEKILGQCPDEKQTLLYSATVYDQLVSLADRYMHDPVRVSVEQKVDPKLLKQVYYQTPHNLKFSLLVHLLNKEQSQLVMVFCNTKHMVDFVARNLQKQGYDATPIHGGMTQAKRKRSMDSFHHGKAQVLVCTDVAARGLHVENVSHVYNYDIPNEPLQYIHRIGRTARAGADGEAINILSDRDYDNFDNVLRTVDPIIEEMEMPQVERVQVHIKPRNNRRRGGRQGGRHQRRSRHRR